MEDKEFEEKDAERKYALSVQDGKTYHNLCIELGIKPENIQLYEEGKVEISNAEQTKINELGRYEKQNE